MGGKTDQFQVHRSPEEQAAFEAAFAERKTQPSLLHQVKEGTFGDAEGGRNEARRVRKQSGDSRALWGLSAGEQDRVAHIGAKTPASQRAFDPEQDLQIRKPMAVGDF